MRDENSVLKPTQIPLILMSVGVDAVGLPEGLCKWPEKPLPPALLTSFHEMTGRLQG